MPEPQSATSVAISPAEPPQEASTSGGAAGSSTDTGSDLLQKIKQLSDTQKALKEQKKKNAIEMKNALKRKKRLQGKASQLSDGDLVEVLRMRKAKKESEKSVTIASTPVESAGST